MRAIILLGIAALALTACGSEKQPREKSYEEITQQRILKQAHANIIKVCISGDKIGRDPESGRLVLNPSESIFTEDFMGTILGPDSSSETVCQ